MMIGSPAAVATRFERRTALVAAGSLFVATLAALNFAPVPLPSSAAFLPIYTTLACGGDALTAYLVFGQARALRRPALNLLALAYTYAAIVIVAHALVFPGLLAPGGLLGATPQTAVWFWVWWHGGFPIFVTAYVAAESYCERRDLRPRVGALVPAAAVLAVAASVAGLLAFTLHADGLLPALIVKGNYRELLSTGVGPLVVSAVLVALGAVIVGTRLRNVISLWLAVALFAMLLDVTLTLAGGGRDTLGWYAARVESLVAAFVVLLSFLGRISRMYEQVARLATIDALTSTLNRRAFDERLASARDFSLRAESPLSIVMLDVDFFKRYNDRYGHVAGDACLRAISEAATSALARRTDLLARYGGEEFALILPGTDASGGRRVAERVRYAVAERALRNEDAPEGIVTVSLGVFGFDPRHDPPLSPTELLARADEALYAAKHKGRNQVVAFGE